MEANSKLGLKLQGFLQNFGGIYCFLRSSNTRQHKTKWTSSSFISVQNGHIEFYAVWFLYRYLWTENSATSSLNLVMIHFRCLSIFMVICFGTMRNAIKFSVHAESVTSLDMILPILPSAINQSFTKNTYKITHYSHALIHPYKSKTILKQLHPNVGSPVSSTPGV